VQHQTAATEPPAQAKNGSLIERLTWYRRKAAQAEGAVAEQKPQSDLLVDLSTASNAETEKPTIALAAGNGAGQEQNGAIVDNDQSRRKNCVIGVFSLI
jgi:hypothetical protein